MSEFITTAFVKEFTSGITLLQQQRGSNLGNAVDIEADIVGDRAFFDQVGSTEMHEITNRHGDTEYTDTPHARRMVTMTPHEVADLLDRPDKVRTLNDPTNTYVRAMAAAAGRKKDDIIISAFDGLAKTGVDGAGSQPFDTDFEVAVDTSNMTVKKLRETRELLEAAENVEDDDMNRWYMVMSANQRKGLLADDKLTSQDFATVRALVDGQVTQFMGFTFLKSERLPKTANNRSCFAWVKSSMGLGVSEDARGFIDILPGKRHSTQIRYVMDVGATRKDEKGVVRILCDETA